MSEPYWVSGDGDVTLHLGDCLAVLATMGGASVDAVVCDPPYGLEFMGREWDGSDGFRRSLNEADAGRDSVFGRTSRTSPEYRTGKPSGARIRPPSEADQSSGRAHNATTSLVARNAPEAYVAGHLFQEWCEAWSRECLRVLKPGGHLLAFGGTRTWHRLACGVEDAGFEIRDSIDWIYAQGFPKSLNVGKDPRFCQCDVGQWFYGHSDLRGVQDSVPDLPEDSAASEVSDVLTAVQRAGAGSRVGGARPQGADSQGGSATRDARCGEPGMEGRRDPQAPEGELHGGPVRPVSSGVPADGASGRLHHGAPASGGPVGRPDATENGSGEPQGSRPVEQCAAEPGIVADERGSQARRGWPVCGGCGKPAVPRGLGSALKPAHEPIVVARKPLAGTLAANVLAHGTGALNVEGCRVAHGADVDLDAVQRQQNRHDGDENWRLRPGHEQATYSPAGRWPPNVLLGAEASAELDRQSGATVSRSGGRTTKALGVMNDDAWTARDLPRTGHDDGGGASRFFPVFKYEPKAPKSERPKLPDGTKWPTVKPLDLMRWLVRLVTPPDGLVLDLFAGSGTTAEACVIEGFRCVLVDKDPVAAELIKMRLSKPIQPTMFGLEAS